jgi:hypothetical protein
MNKEIKIGRSFNALLIPTTLFSSKSSKVHEPMNFFYMVDHSGMLLMVNEKWFKFQMCYRTLLKLKGSIKSDDNNKKDHTYQINGKATKNDYNPSFL